MARATIIIPTYNRPGYLQRLLGYYHKYGRDFDIVVADSSSDENKKLNKENILSFPDLNIQYVDKYPQEIDPYSKFADMISYAKEKYCVFCADDDFIVPNGINQSVDFLEKNPDFTVAHGRYIVFWLNPKNKREKQFCWRVCYSNQSITFPESENRLIKHLSDFIFPTFYGVFRTDFLKTIWRELLDSKVNLIVFGEMLLSAHVLIYGKMKCLDDVLYMAKQYGIDTDHKNWPSLTDLWKMNQDKYNEEYAKFRQYLAVRLTKKSQLSIEESKKVIDGAMSQYIKKYWSPDFKQTLSRALIEKAKYILNSFLVPDWMYRKIRLLYKKIFCRQETDDFIVSLDNPGSSKYCDDFERIKSQVIK